MKRNSSAIVGVILILAGIALVLGQYDFFGFKYLRSYGLFLAGILFLFQGIANSSQPRIYFSTVIALFGFYYILDTLDIIYAYRELNISVYVLILGLSFYPVFFFGNRKLNHLLVGNLITLIGLMFLFWHLEVIDHRFLINFIDRYWPLVLIILGLIFLIGSFQQQREKAQK
jgi:hypothetical protein